MLILSLRKLRGFLLYDLPKGNSLCLLSLVFIAVHVILSNKILRSYCLNDKNIIEIWNSLVMAINNSNSGSNTLKLDYVVGVIISEEMQSKTTCDTSGNALTMESRGRQRKYRVLGLW